EGLLTTPGRRARDDLRGRCVHVTRPTDRAQPAEEQGDSSQLEPAWNVARPRSVMAHLALISHRSPWSREARGPLPTIGRPPAAPDDTTATLAHFEWPSALEHIAREKKRRTRAARASPRSARCTGPPTRRGVTAPAVPPLTCDGPPTVTYSTRRSPNRRVHSLIELSRPLRGATTAARPGALPAAAGVGSAARCAGNQRAPSPRSAPGSRPG